MKTIKICIRKTDDNHYEQYIRYNDNYGYIYQGWFLSYEGAMNHVNWYTDRGAEIKQHNSSEEIYLRGEKLLFETWLIANKETECSVEDFIDHYPI